MGIRSEGSESSKVVTAVLERLEGLTREQWLERLDWVPEGQEHKRLSASALEAESACHTRETGVSPVKARPAEQGAFAASHRGDAVKG